jgi:hypothetical protein
LAEEKGISVSVSDTDWGVFLQATPNHLLALNHWSGATDSGTDPLYDYSKLIATIALETDQRLELTYELPEGDGSTMDIVARDAELWVLAPNTVVGVTPGGVLKVSPPYAWTIRNDAERLSFVMAGAIAERLLRTSLGIETLGYAKEIGTITMPNCTVDEIRQLRYSNPVRCPHLKTAQLMERAVVKARNQKDSVGGIVEAMSLGVPIGLGEPPLSELDSDLSKALFSVPAVKGVEFGLGFESSRKRGSEYNDALRIRGETISYATNNAGGIIGGISTGMPIIIRIAFKPTPSISKIQRTIDVTKKKNASISVTGRHDPCVVPRAVPVVESVISLVLADHALRSGKIPTVLKD